MKLFSRYFSQLADQSTADAAEEFLQIKGLLVKLYSSSIADLKNLYDTKYSTVAKNRLQDNPNDPVISQAQECYDKLNLAMDDKNTDILQRKLQHLGRTIGYFPGINWKLIGAFALGIGALMMPAAKFLPIPKIAKIGILVLGATALAAGALVCAYSCCKPSKDSQLVADVKFRVFEHTSTLNLENISASNSVRALASERGQNFKRWSDIYSNYFSEPVNQAIEICGGSKQR